MEEEKNKKLDEIEKTLKSIHKILRPTRWRIFVEGLWRAFGYFFGLMLSIIILGWFLNIIGIIPFMNEFSENMKEVLNVAKNR